MSTSKNSSGSQDIGGGRGLREEESIPVLSLRSLAPKGKTMNVGRSGEIP